MRNLLADPRVEVRAPGQWYDGQAQVLPDDDPVARLKIGHTVNGWFVEAMGAPTCSPSASTSAAESLATNGSLVRTGRHLTHERPE